MDQRLIEIQTVYAHGKRQEALKQLQTLARESSGRTRLEALTLVAIRGGPRMSYLAAKQCALENPHDVPSWQLLEVIARGKGFHRVAQKARDHLLILRKKSAHEGENR
jgi:hypothetical protein